MAPDATPSVPPSPAVPRPVPVKNPSSRSKAPPSASASGDTSSSVSSKSSAQKRKAMASASTTPLPGAKVAKPTAGTSTVATRLGPSTRSRAAATTTTTPTTTTTADPSSDPPGRISPQSEFLRKKKVFTTEETDWLVALLQTPRIYHTLQDYSVPKDWVYERIAEEFNSDFKLTSVEVTPDQIAMKIRRIKTLFRRADARRVQMRFYGLPKEQWDESTLLLCPHYFELHQAWINTWGSLVPQYLDSDSCSDEGRRKVYSDDDDDDERESESEAGGGTHGDAADQPVVVDENSTSSLPLGRERAPTALDPPSSEPPAQQEQASCRPQEPPRSLEQPTKVPQEEQEPAGTQTIQREVAENRESVSAVSGLGPEVQLNTEQRELAAWKIKDETDLALARERLDLEAKVLALEQRRLDLRVMECERDHARRLQAIRADKYNAAFAALEEKSRSVDTALHRIHAFMARFDPERPLPGPARSSTPPPSTVAPDEAASHSKTLP